MAKAVKVELSAKSVKLKTTEVEQPVEANLGRKRALPQVALRTAKETTRVSNDRG